jgi:chitinase
MRLARLALGCAAPLILSACSGGGRVIGPPEDIIPGAPSGVTAVAGDGSALVSWTAPTPTGGSAILHYRVVASSGTSVIVDAPALSTVFSGLANGSTYTFTVFATNLGGESVGSAPSAPVTPHAAAPTPASTRWVTGYYVGYQQALYPVDEVDMSLMTHLVVGRVRPASDGSLVTDFDIDNVNGPAMARALSARAHAAGKKAILMLGGAGEHEGFVGAASAANRAAFETRLLKALDDYGFDGLDVDWEPLDAVDRAPLMALLTDLRARRPGIILTVPIGWVSANFPEQADPWYAQLAGVVDQLNVMTYDMAGDWGGWVSWHSAALYGEGGNHPSSVSSSIAAYRAAGVPAAKLGIGLGFYGQCWVGVTGPLQPLGARTKQGVSDNEMSFTRIRTVYWDASARHWDASARVPYLAYVDGKGPQGCSYITYEDEESVAEKGAFVRAQGLGGAIVWTIGEGHFSVGVRDPLLKAAHDAILP